MTDEEFETLKVTFENDLLQPPKGFSDEIDYYWPIVARGNSCPDKGLKEIPERPTQKEFQNALHPLDIPAKALHRTPENHEAADILAKVDSSARHEIVRKANHHFFP